MQYVIKLDRALDESWEYAVTRDGIAMLSGSAPAMASSAQVLRILGIAMSSAESELEPRIQTLGELAKQASKNHMDFVEQTLAQLSHVDVKLVVRQIGESQTVGVAHEIVRKDDDALLVSIVSIEKNLAIRPVARWTEAGRSALAVRH